MKAPGKSTQLQTSTHLMPYIKGDKPKKETYGEPCIRY